MKAIIQSNNKPGKITISATAKGLIGGSATIETLAEPASLNNGKLTDNK